MKLMISQSNYIPWKGYFDSIALVDKVVLYDDMQFTKRDWRNRNLIKTPYGLKWMTIPVEVKGRFNQKINETKVSDLNWNISHLNLLKQNYKYSKCYRDVIEWIEQLYFNCNFTYLSDINLYFLNEILNFLKIKTSLEDSRNFKIVGDKTEKLVNICKDLTASEYFTGSAARSYLNEEQFNDNGINVNYFDYSDYSVYDQIYDGFTHEVSILDLIFNEGTNSIFYLKYADK
jgi:hypothetical protein